MKIPRIFMIVTFLMVIGFNLLAVEVNNSKKPTVPQKDFELKNSIVMSDDFFGVTDFKIAADKIITVDAMSKSVVILDLKGEIINIIDAQGKGPGELSMPTNIFLEESEGRFGIVDQMNRRVSYYDFSGNYIEDEPFEGMSVPIDKGNIANHDINYNMKISIDKEKGKVTSKPTIALKLNEEEIILHQSSFDPMKMNLQNTLPMFCNNSDYICVSVMSTDEYKIKKYDSKGNLLQTITKDFDKIKKPEEDIKKIEERFDEMKERVKAAGSNLNINLSDLIYEYSIMSLELDDENNIWALTVDDRGYLFDKFNKKGKIVTQYKIGDSMSDVRVYRFYQGNFYTFSGNEDDGFKLKVYSVN